MTIRPEKARDFEEFLCKNKEWLRICYHCKEHDKMCFFADIDGFCKAPLRCPEKGRRECESCASCRHSHKIVMYDYSGTGCEHIQLNGYACTAFAPYLDGEDEVIWMFKGTMVRGCECYEPRKERE